MPRQHARPIGPTTTNAAAPFSVEMSTGSRPARIPTRATWFPAANRLGSTQHQVAQSAAPFSQDMVAGCVPQRNRYTRVLSMLGWTDPQTWFTFIGYIATRTVNTDARRGTNVTTNTDARRTTAVSVNVDAQFGTRKSANTDAR